MNKEKIEKPNLTLYRMAKSQQFQKGGATPKGLTFGGNKNGSSTKKPIKDMYAEKAAKSAKKKKAIAKKVANTYLPKGDSIPNKSGVRFKKKQILQNGGMVTEAPYKAQDGMALKNEAIRKRKAAEMAKSKAVWGTDYNARNVAGKAANIRSGIEFKNQQVQDSIGAANRNAGLRKHVLANGPIKNPLAIGQPGTAPAGVTPSGNRGNLYKTSVKYRR